MGVSGAGAGGGASVHNVMGGMVRLGSGRSPFVNRLQTPQREEVCIITCTCCGVCVCMCVHVCSLYVSTYALYFVMFCVCYCT